MKLVTFQTLEVNISCILGTGSPDPGVDVDVLCMAYWICLMCEVRQAVAPCPTCVFPPVLSCTALLERAVLEAKALNAAPNILLTPKAISSYDKTHKKT